MFLMLFPPTVFADEYALDLDLQQLLQWWRLDVEKRWDLYELPKSLVEWNIYNTSYARAELQVAWPAVDTLDQTYKYIASRCDGNISQSDVNTVFAVTQPGIDMFWYLQRRWAADVFNEDENFWDACRNVVTCFSEPERKIALAEWEEVKEIEYTNETRRGCQRIVEHGYEMMSVSVAAISAMKDINYGDDMLMNAKRDDGPFDLLQDIEQIGNLLFTHNDPPTEVHFYDVQPPSTYVDNDPDVITPYVTDWPPNIDEDDPVRRIPATNGIDPDFPRSIYYDEDAREPEWTYTPPDQNVEDFSLYTDPSPIGGSANDMQQLETALWAANQLPSATSLQNVVCIEPEPIPIEEELNILDLAELQQEHTYAYNKKLDIESRVALASAAIMSPEIEELYGIDPVEVLDGTWVDPESVPPLFDDAWMEWDDMEAMEEWMKWCLEQFTDLNGDDTDTVRKAVWKNITQPTAFTNCVLDLMCFELSDDTGRWLYRIRWCKVPSRKSYSVSDSQKVVSLEEAVDAFLNVCTNLKESWQLLEHNKTKDAWDHKLMRVKFGDKFNFSLSVWFKWLTNKIDPAHEKRMSIENNAYLEDALLWLSDNLLEENQRNKYVSLIDPTKRSQTKWLNTIEQNTLNVQWQALAEGDWREIAQKEQNSQLRVHAKTLDVLDAFVDLNTDYWVTINDTTHSIMWIWQKEKKESQEKW